jgi:hypothetical protein
VIERVTALNVRNQGFTDAFLAADPTGFDFAAHRTAMLAEVGRIARRAVEAGALRADFVVDDFVLVLQAGRGLTALPRASRPAAAKRYAALAIEGFRAAPGNGALPPRARLAK